LERLNIYQIRVCHGPLLSLVAEHALNLSDVVLEGTATPGMIDALAAMPRCRSLTLLLRGLNDEHIARILRGEMCDSLRIDGFQTTRLASSARHFCGTRRHLTGSFVRVVCAEGGTPSAQ
jgi:hypothetical protein